MHQPSSRLVSRRVFAAGIAATCAWPQIGRAQSQLWASNPFSLGVASGFPLADGFSVWTRLAPQPMQRDGGMPAEPVAVTCEIAQDAAFAQIVQTLRLTAETSNAHAVHGFARGLQADRWYWYRFTSGGAVSPVGRSRTTPVAQSTPQKLKLILASCQHYEAGHYAAWRHAAQQEADLVLFVGDYIYENPYSRATRMREHDGPAPRDLPAYRLRYALYKLDPDLQAAHAAFPWMLMWDDHEVENDYAALTSARLIEPATFAAQRLAAYKAYWEHMPMPRHCQRFSGPGLALNAHVAWGQLADLWTIDVRQHRSVHACQPPVGAEGKGGGKLMTTQSCPELLDTSRTLLGWEQERWIESECSTSKSAWRILVQPSQMSGSYIAAVPGQPDRIWTDAWDGYPAARERLLQAASKGSRSILSLGGDVHRHVAAQLRAAPNSANSPVLASEFVTSSISSRGMNDLAMAALKANNPDIAHARSDERGYALIEVGAQQTYCDFMGTPHPVRANSVFRRQARYRVERERPGVELA